MIFIIKLFYIHIKKFQQNIKLKNIKNFNANCNK